MARRARPTGWRADAGFARPSSGWCFIAPTPNHTCDSIPAGRVWLVQQARQQDRHTQPAAAGKALGCPRATRMLPVSRIPRPSGARAAEKATPGRQAPSTNPRVASWPGAWNGSSRRLPAWCWRKPAGSTIVRGFWGPMPLPQPAKRQRNKSRTPRPSSFPGRLIGDRCGGNQLTPVTDMAVPARLLGVAKNQLASMRPRLVDGTSPSFGFGGRRTAGQPTPAAASWLVWCGIPALRAGPGEPRRRQAGYTSNHAGNR